MTSLYELDKEYILNTYKRMNIEIVKGEGSYLFDKDNNKYLDMFSGIAVNNLGLSNAGIIEKIISQASKFIHISNYFPCELTVNLARLLVENSFASKVFFCNSGTEAIEATIKLSRKYGKSFSENKIEILSAYNSFHGRTCGGVSITGQDKYKKSFAPLLPGVKHFEMNNIKSFNSCISQNTCAVYLELIQGEGGVVEANQEFVDYILKLSHELNFLVVIDEIQTGLCRTGDLFAYEKYGIKPDLVTLAKSLGGGIPMGAMLVSKKLENVFVPGDHGTTFGGNALASAVGEYVLSVMVQKDFKRHITEKSIYLIEKLNILKVKYPQIIKDIRGRGLMIGIDTGIFADQIKEMALTNYLLLNVTNQTVVRLLPALTISIDELNEFLSIFEKSLQSIK